MADTTNYNLEKPGENDFYDINVFNRNCDKIDAALKGIEARLNRVQLPVYGRSYGNSFNLTQFDVIKYIEINLPVKFDKARFIFTATPDSPFRYHDSSVDIELYKGINRIVGTNFYRNPASSSETSSLLINSFTENFNYEVGSDADRLNPSLYLSYIITSVEIIEREIYDSIRIGGKATKSNAAIVSSASFKLNLDWFAWE